MKGIGGKEERLHYFGFVHGLNQNYVGILGGGRGVGGVELRRFVLVFLERESKRDSAVFMDHDLGWKDVYECLRFLVRYGTSNMFP